MVIPNVYLLRTSCSSSAAPLQKGFPGINWPPKYSLTKAGRPFEPPRLWQRWVVEPVNLGHGQCVQIIILLYWNLLFLVFIMYLFVFRGLKQPLERAVDRSRSGNVCVFASGHNHMHTHTDTSTTVLSAAGDGCGESVGWFGELWSQRSVVVGAAHRLGCAGASGVAFSATGRGGAAAIAASAASVSASSSAIAIAAVAAAFLLLLLTGARDAGCWKGISAHTKITST